MVITCISSSTTIRLRKYYKILPNYVCLKLEFLLCNDEFREYNVENTNNEYSLRPIFVDPDDEFRAEVLEDIRTWAKTVYDNEMRESQERLLKTIGIEVW